MTSHTVLLTAEGHNDDEISYNGRRNGPSWDVPYGD